MTCNCSSAPCSCMVRNRFKFNLLELFTLEQLQTIKNNVHRLTKEEQELIEKIAKKLGS